MAKISKEPWKGRGFSDLENYLAERLEMIEGGEGHWSRCMEAIEKYATERRSARERRNSVKKNKSVYPKHIKVEQRGPYSCYSKPDVWYYDTDKKLEFCLAAGAYTYLFEVRKPKPSPAKRARR